MHWKNNRPVILATAPRPGEAAQAALPRPHRGTVPHTTAQTTSCFCSLHALPWPKSSPRCVQSNRQHVNIFCMASVPLPSAWLLSFTVDGQTWYELKRRWRAVGLILVMLQFIGGGRTIDEYWKALGTVFDPQGALANQLRKKKITMVTVDTGRYGAQACCEKLAHLYRSTFEETSWLQCSAA